MAHPRIMIIGSDSTSDLYGSELAKMLKQINQKLVLFGVGGILMQKAGVKLLYDISSFDSLGVSDSIKGIHIMKRLVKRLSESMDKLRPDVIVQIGLPVFNLRVIELAKAKDIPVLYYDTPINWGSNQIKTNKLAKIVDQVIGVSRYEVDVCQENNIIADFIGHPLVDIAQSGKSKRDFLKTLDVDLSLPIVAFLPGTRQIDIKTLLPTLLKAINRIQTELQAVEVLVGFAPTIRAEWINSMIAKSGVADVKVVFDTHEILHICDVAVVGCGYESVEAPLANVPTIAVQKFTTSALFDRRSARKKYFSLVNFLMQDEIILELTKDDFSEAGIFEAVKFLLEDEEKRQNMIAGFSGLSMQLGEPGTIKRAAKLIYDKLDLELESNL